MALRRAWYWPVAGAVLGIILALVVILTVRPRYEGVASVLLRNLSAYEVSASTGLAPSASARGGLADMLSLDPGFDTEVAILSSRAVIGQVVSELGLQAELVRPGGESLDSLLVSASFEEDLEEGTYEFQRTNDGVRVRGPSVSRTFGAGEPIVLPGAVLSLRSVSEADEFELRLRDFTEAVDWVRKALTVGRAGGSVAELVYRSTDRARAPMVPNALVDAYLERRRTTDRGISTRRYEFLTHQADSLSTELASASLRLREHQEQSGLLSPDARAEAEVVQAMELRARAQELSVEARALEQTLGRTGGSEPDAKVVASYPVLLTNPAVNELLVRLADLEADRALLLERRTEEDPDVELLTREIERVENEIVRIARAYQAAVLEQLGEVRSELGTLNVALETLPEQVERSFHLQREVERLAGAVAGIQADLVRTRLAAIAEGGDVRQIDIAEFPRKPVFPLPLLTVALGLLGGGFFGMAAALLQPAVGSRIRSLPQLERMVGVPVIVHQPAVPLLVGAIDGAESVLVLPVGEGVGSGNVARDLARSASLRGRKVVLMEWGPQGSPDRGSGSDPALEASTAKVQNAALQTVGESPSYAVWRANGGGPNAARIALLDLEGDAALVIAALPSIDRGLTAALLHPVRPVLLVAQTGVTRVDELEGTMDTLARLGVGVEGVVLAGSADGS